MVINLVAYAAASDIHRQIAVRLFWRYAEQDFPTDRFDDISELPGQIRFKAMSPLCHSSVSSWTLCAGAPATSRQKKERCAKVASEVVFTIVCGLNDHFEGE